MAPKGEAAAALMMMVVVVGMVAGQVSAAAPTECIIKCMGPDAIVLDLFYCVKKCNLPPTNTLAAVHTADSFCKLGCISHKCAVLFSNSGDEAVEGCVQGCGAICSSATTTTNPIKMGRSPVV